MRNYVTGIFHIITKAVNSLENYCDHLSEQIDESEMQKKKAPVQKEVFDPRRDYFYDSD
ncbi:hypothetical protein TK90_2799 (plasmid) [Thioalkalivibrio sp. K90mix]|nr:hypothetical protein TK90_2799 [Thioalkalivibrio sp. K90mix]